MATLSAGTSAQYYTSLTNYYTEVSEPRGKWLAVGLDLRIAAGLEVDTADFERLHAGLDLTGLPMLPKQADRAQRVGGYDLTFSAPKSVSILWGLADDELRAKIERAQESAVTAALKVLEENAAFCRHGKGGARREHTRLTVAYFQHGDARPAEHEDGQTFSDPNLHSHAVALNLGQKRDSVGALDGKALFAWKMASGAAYHAELAKGLGEIGLAIEPDGSNGLFEVAGIDAELRNYFSARRRDIENELDKHGLVSHQAPALAAEITRVTRRAKRDLGKEDRRASWSRHTRNLGRYPSEIVRGCLQSHQIHDRSISEEERDAALRAKIDAIPNALTENESIFERRHLHAAISAALVGTGHSMTRVESEIERLQGAGALVTLSRDVWGHPVLTTPEMYAIERGIGQMARDLDALRSSVPDPSLVDRLIAATTLGPEQIDAIRAATRGDTITIIEGAPGSGKTTTLRPIKEAWEDAGYRVIGSATAWKIANMLRDDLQIEARATDSWLAKAAAGRPFLNAKTVLVLDEAGLLSSRQMHAVLAAFREVARDGATPKLILVGDWNQLQAVGAGAGLRLVTEAIEAKRVEAIQRQKEPWLRDAILDFGRGEAGAALRAFADRGFVRHGPDRKATIEALVDRWEQTALVAPKENVLVIAATNADVRAISQVVRQRLRRDGSIRGDEVTIDASSPSGHDVKLPLARGDHIRFLCRAQLDGHEVINGTEATVVSVGPDRQNKIRVVARIGDEHLTFTTGEVEDERGRARIAHAYSTTVYGAQGLTADRALVLMTPDMNRHAIYVAASRARQETTFFVDDKALDARMRSDLPLSDQGRIRQFAAERRAAFVAERLSRSGVKRTTLDVTSTQETQRQSPASSIERQERRPPRVRGLDLSDG